VVIRSYRRVFDVDRRIYRVDRWTLPVPGGIPLRGLGYFLGTLLAVIVCGRLPGLGDALGELTPPLRYVVLPVLVAMFGCQVAPDGRAAHRFAWDWLCLRVRARRRCGGRPVALEGEPVRWDGTLGVRFDGDGAELHRGRVSGPARVRFAVPVRLAYARGGWVVRPGDENPGAVVLGGGEGLEVAP
jgi:hypothetical protein